MNRHAAGFAVFLCVFLCCPVSGQVYAQPEADEGTAALSKIEIGISGVLSAGDITDGNGAALSQKMMGGRLRVLFPISTKVSAGLEGTYLQAQDIQTPFLSHITKYMLAAAVKWRVTQRMYVIGQAGGVANRAALELAFNDLDKEGVVYGGGIGYEVSIGKGWKLAGEYRVSYEPGGWSNFIMNSEKMRQEFTAGVVWTF